MLGGIDVVIFSDVRQMFIIIAGLLICGWVGMDLLSWDTVHVLEAYDNPEWFQILNFEQCAFYDLKKGRTGQTDSRPTSCARSTSS